MKICTSCKQEKSLDEFYNSKVYKDGKGYRCKPCDAVARRNYDKRHREQRLKNQRKANRKFQYNLTEEQFEQMLLDQRNCCAICEVQLKEYGHNKHKADSLHVDHDHKSGKVRGLLCANCNRGLGLFKDNIEFLRQAIDYLNINGDIINGIDAD